MTRKTWASTLVAAALLLAAPDAWATPSTQIWIPSTDVQRFATLHLNYDVYARPEKLPLLMLGPTVGFLPFDKLQAEAGFDLMFQGTSYDRYPLYFHAKVAVPEDALFKFQPALAFGVYNVGIHRTDAANTMQNVGYALIARTLPYVGRLSVGYYLGNAAVLRAPVDAARPELGSKPDNHGFLASWDRTMSEISDKLWLCVDFQQGSNILGAINAGLSWSFTRDISVIVGYDHYWNQDAANWGAGKDTFTVQLDISLFVPEDKPASTAPAPVDSQGEANRKPVEKKDDPQQAVPSGATEEKPAGSP